MEGNHRRLTADAGGAKAGAVGGERPEEQGPGEARPEVGGVEVGEVFGGKHATGSEVVRGDGTCHGRQGGRVSGGPRRATVTHSYMLQASAGDRCGGCWGLTRLVATQPPYPRAIARHTRRRSSQHRLNER